MLTCLAARIVYDQFKTYITCNFIGYPLSDLKCYTTKLLRIYLAYLLINPSRLLRSSLETLLWNPTYDLKTYGGRSLVVAGPPLWNPLPQSVKDSTSVDTLNVDLKKRVLTPQGLLWMLIFIVLLWFYSL